MPLDIRCSKVKNKLRQHINLVKMLGYYDLKVSNPIEIIDPTDLTGQQFLTDRGLPVLNKFKDCNNCLYGSTYKLKSNCKETYTKF